MRTDWTHLERDRTSPRGYESKPGDHFGWFVWYSDNGRTQLRALATDGQDVGEGWEHVSVSVAYRVGGRRSNKWKERDPTWMEMCFIKNKFWDEKECVVQFHPASADYVNQHPHCLHLWKGPEQFPMPAKIFV